ncbi:MAG TPA: MATE family efflux transporter [Candidatus Acidoferrales bacterium]|jgi:MATE family multidrug resistance protein|nr:MATE family efflux transporter [Candidatus Acidoferrales bacterium]
MLKRLFLHYIADEARPMLRLATPIVLAEVGWMSMSIVDTMMVGRQADSALAIGAVSLGSTLYYVVAIFGTGLMLGLDTLVSHSYGAGDLEDAHRSLVNGIYLSVALAPVLMGVVWLWAPLLRGLKIQQSLLAQAIPYLHALNWSTLPLLLYFVFRRYLQGVNLAKPVMFSLLTANLVNVLGNWAFIYGHLGFRAMGTVGSGWATCVGRVYMAMVLLVYCIYYDLRYKTGLREASKRVHLPRVWKLVSLGFPAATQLGLEVGIFAVATAMISKLGAIQLAAHQVAMNTASFTYMVPLGIGSAAAVRVGQALGRRDAPAASRAGWTALALGSSFMLCMAIAFWLAPQYIVRVYSPDPEVVRTASQLLFVAAFFQLFDGLQAVATGALRGAGETRAPMICSVLFYWVAGLPLGYYLCFGVGWGAAGVWTGLCLALILIGSSLLLLWRREEKSFAGRLVSISDVRVGDPA